MYVYDLSTRGMTDNAYEGLFASEGALVNLVLPDKSSSISYD